MTVWFTSDTHFGHTNILRLSRRPFADIQQHDEALVSNWNARVKRQDEVWHLGDFALDVDEKSLLYLFERLNGRKNLVVGNHDNCETLRLPWASKPKQIQEIVIDQQRVVLCHFALRSWRRIRDGSVHLYGHTHGTIPGTQHSEDAGVDAWDFSPITLQDLLARMALNSTIEDEFRYPPPNPGGSRIKRCR